MTGVRPTMTDSSEVAVRAEELFEQRFQANVRRTDRLFAYLLVGQWLFAILLALVVSPYSWAGLTRSVHLHVYLALFLGAAINALPLALIWTRPGAPVTRTSVAVAQMLWSGLLIHLTGGRLETHFHVFGSLAFIAFYRDWKLLVPATLVVSLDHLLRQLFFPESVFGVSTPESWRFLEHSAWVLFEDAFLAFSCVQGVREMRGLAKQQARIEHNEQLEKEMEIASHIQTALLPDNPVVFGLEIAATMLPAADVGGDYYDVLPVEGGCWVGVGDVAGHGLTAGLVMLQSQSAVRALVRQDPNRPVRELLANVNHVLYENVRSRSGPTEHMTMSLIRYHQDGRIIVAGAHQSILICRAGTGRCERHDTDGTWLGLVEDVLPVTHEKTFKLEIGDLLVLFTDGVTEAMNPQGDSFGLDRLCAEVERSTHRTPAEIRDDLMAKVTGWCGERLDDDVTVLVLRHVGVGAARAAA